MVGRITSYTEPPLGFIVFDHEERLNAIGVEMWRAIPDAVRTLVSDDDVRVIILRGAGERAFVSGADISEFSETRTGDAAAQYERETTAAFDALDECPKPLLAMNHGTCIGGGVAIALTADLRYAADDAVFAVPAARLGLGYHVSGYRALIDVVGPSTAKEIVLTAGRFTAPEALRRRLLTEVVAKDDLDNHVRSVARSIAKNAPLTVQSAKLIVRELGKPSAQQDHERMSASIAACFASEDYREGVSAFLEKRRANFRGR
jgi:enoyl-CoA hydratase/carnithine racemase